MFKIRNYLATKNISKHNRVYITVAPHISSPYQLSGPERVTAVNEVLNQLQKWFDAMSEPNKEVAKNVTTHQIASYLLAEFIHIHKDTLQQLRQV